MIKLDKFIDVWNTKEQCCIDTASTIEYYINYGERHNLNGPAIIYKLYPEDNKYFIYSKFIGTNLTEKAFKKKIKELIFA